MSKKETVPAVIEGDGIVIRMPIDRLIEFVERRHDAKVQDTSTFVAEILADMNKMVGGGISVAEDNFVRSAQFLIEDGSVSMIQSDGQREARPWHRRSADRKLPRRLCAARGITKMAASIGIS